MRELSQLKGFGPVRLEALAKRGIISAMDLVERLPTGYRDTTHPLSPAQMTQGVQGCFEGFMGVLRCTARAECSGCPRRWRMNAERFAACGSTNPG